MLNSLYASYNLITMLKINEKNIKTYLVKTLPTVLGINKNRFSIIKSNEITEQTYVNYIFRTEVKLKKVFYLRQSRDHIKAAPDQKADPKRISYEVNILNLLNNIVKDIVPEVIYLDKKNNIAFLTDIKRGAPLLVNELLEGRPHPQTGKYFGEIIAKIHGQTFGKSNRRIRGSDKENKKARDFHMGMRLKPAKKILSKDVQSLLEDSNKAPKCLVLGDLASKNIFIDKDKVRFLDLERSFVGDPAFDLGFLFCHYLIEIKPQKREQSLEFINQFMKSYCNIMMQYLSRTEIQQLSNRAIRFLGVTILYRLFGFYMVVNIKRRKKYWIKTAKNLLQGKSSFSNLLI